MAQEACKNIKDDLIACVLKSNCVLRQNNSPQDCIRHPDQLPEQCRHLITSFSNCKRGMLDMRKRFRGNNITSQSSPTASS